jgi:hypothetical protein
MPLSTAKPQLEKDILLAFEKALKTGRDAGQDDKSAQIRKDLAKDIANAVDVYVKAAQVNISAVVSTVPPGVAVAAPPPAGTGATVSVGIAKHAGFGSLQ